MTLIEYSDEGGRLKIKAEGHATGSVEICSAVSTLMLGFQKYLEDWEEIHTTHKEDGMIEIESNCSLQALGAFRLITGTLKGLADENPNYIKVVGATTK